MSSYIPKVNDYVKWIDPPFHCEEGWVYFVTGDIPNPPGFPKQQQYITIEIGVRDRPNCDTNNGTCLHKKIHTLLLCFEKDWKNLKYIKSRKSKHLKHYSECDDQMSLNDYIKEPKRDWTDKQWLQYAYVQYHNPWINYEDKMYYKDMITRLSVTNRFPQKMIKTVEKYPEQYYKCLYKQETVVYIVFHNLCISDTLSVEIVWNNCH